MLPLAAFLLLQAAAADRVWINGNILTMDPSGGTAQAVAVRDGRILAVGGNQAVRSAASPDASVVDLAGRTMLPGFYAAHDHFPASGFMGAFYVDLNSPPMGNIRDIGQLVAALAEKARTLRPGEWIIGRGYDDTLLAERRHPTRADLDRASTRHPIWIVHTSGHLGAANSLALETARIGRDTPQPAAGVIRRDASGEPTGVIEEALSLIGRHTPSPTLEQRMQAVKAATASYRARGVTTAVVAGGSRDRIVELKTARARGFLALGIVQMLSGGDSVPAGASETAAWRSRDGSIRTGAVKLFQDGSIQGYTGYLSAPYHERRERGYPARSKQELIAQVSRYHKAGYQIAIHGNGDAAIDDILDAFEAAQRDNPRSDTRHRIEHCQTAREDQLDRMKKLGVTPSFFVAHVYYWGDRHSNLFLGPERAARISPLASALRRGLRFTLHNDTPVTPVDPLHLVWCAVNRVTRAGAVLGPDQRIAALAALRAVTIDAAWQNFDETSRGSIEPGKIADLVILAENPLAVPPVRIRDIAILETFLAGR